MPVPFQDISEQGLGTDPLNEDTDGDGVQDGTEIGVQSASPDSVAIAERKGSNDRREFVFRVPIVDREPITLLVEVHFRSTADGDELWSTRKGCLIRWTRRLVQKASSDGRRNLYLRFVWRRDCHSR